MSTSHPTPLHWTFLGLLSLAWGIAFLLIAVALEGFGPLTVVAIRLWVGMVTLYLIMHWQGHSLPPWGPWWWRFALLGLSGNILPFSLISWAEVHISSAQAGLLLALMPISTLVLAHYFVPGDRFTKGKVAGILLGLLGVGILFGDDLGGDNGLWATLAQSAILVATLSYAVNAVYAKRLPAIDPLVMSTGSLLFASIVALVLCLLLEFDQITGGLPGWYDRSLWAALALGVAPTGLATWMYFKVIGDCGPSFLALTNYLIPCVAFAAGVLLLGEQASINQFIGLAVILLGIAMTQRLAPNKASPNAR